MITGHGLFVVAPVSPLGLTILAKDEMTEDTPSEKSFDMGSSMVVSLGCFRLVVRSSGTSWLPKSEIFKHIN